MVENAQQTPPDPPIHPWIAAARERGLTGALDVILDVLEPIGPLGAQVLYIVQPISGVLGWRQAVGDIATALEEPGGVDALRRALHTDDTPDAH